MANYFSRVEIKLQRGGTTSRHPAPGGVCPPLDGREYCRFDDRRAGGHPESFTFSANFATRMRGVRNTGSRPNTVGSFVDILPVKAPACGIFRRSFACLSLPKAAWIAPNDDFYNTWWNSQEFNQRHSFVWPAWITAAGISFLHPAA
jgi:hypothetical protein